MPAGAMCRWNSYSRHAKGSEGTHVQCLGTALASGESSAHPFLSQPPAEGWDVQTGEVQEDMLILPKQPRSREAAEIPACPKSDGAAWQHVDVLEVCCEAKWPQNPGTVLHSPTQQRRHEWDGMGWNGMCSRRFIF